MFPYKNNVDTEAHMPFIKQETRRRMINITGVSIVDEYTTFAANSVIHEI